MIRNTHYPGKWIVYVSVRTEERVQPVYNILPIRYHPPGKRYSTVFSVTLLDTVHTTQSRESVTVRLPRDQSTSIPLENVQTRRQRRRVSAVVVSLYATAGMCWFSVCWGHDTDVSRVGMYDWVRQLDVSPSTRCWSLEVYVSHEPHQEATVVFGYIEESFLVSRTGDAHEHYVPNISRFIHT